MKNKNKIYLYIAIFCLFAFFLLSIFIIVGNTIFYDKPIYEFVSKLPLKEFFLEITHFGSFSYIITAAFLLVVFLKKNNDKKLTAILVAVEGLSNSLLKRIYARPRPPFEHLVVETSYSFPSGHTMSSVVLYSLFVYFLWQSKLAKVWKIIGTVLAVLLIISISFSRIYLGVHYASDVLGGLLLGGFIVSFGLFLYRSLSWKD